MYGALLGTCQHGLGDQGQPPREVRITSSKQVRITSSKQGQHYRYPEVESEELQLVTGFWCTCMVACTSGNPSCSHRSALDTVP